MRRSGSKRYRVRRSPAAWDIISADIKGRTLAKGNRDVTVLQKQEANNSGINLFFEIPVVSNSKTKSGSMAEENKMKQKLDRIKKELDSLSEYMEDFRNSCWQVMEDNSSYLRNQVGILIASNPGTDSEWDIT